ncbi:hypothetical protein HN51_048577 [Arachis hypogaea]
MSPSLGLNNMLNFSGAHVTQLATSSHSESIHQVPNSAWCSNKIVLNLGLSQFSQLPNSQVSDEFDALQPGRRHHVNLE